MPMCSSTREVYRLVMLKKLPIYGDMERGEIATAVMLQNLALYGDIERGEIATVVMLQSLPYKEIWREEGSRRWCRAGDAETG